MWNVELRQDPTASLHPRVPKALLQLLDKEQLGQLINDLPPEHVRRSTLRLVHKNDTTGRLRQIPEKHLTTQLCLQALPKCQLVDLVCELAHCHAATVRDSALGLLRRTDRLATTLAAKYLKKPAGTLGTTARESRDATKHIVAQLAEVYALVEDIGCYMLCKEAIYGALSCGNALLQFISKQHENDYESAQISCDFAEKLASCLYVDLQNSTVNSPGEEHEVFLATVDHIELWKQKTAHLRCYRKVFTRVENYAKSYVKQLQLTTGHDSDSDSEVDGIAIADSCASEPAASSPPAERRPPASDRAADVPPVPATCQPPVTSVGVRADPDRPDDLVATEDLLRPSSLPARASSFREFQDLQRQPPAAASGPPTCASERPPWRDPRVPATRTSPEF
eukprot:TRINITY_DN30750_c0_g1_i1.p1 TRINITY_DN30750_c0_g1~~TRINITY_DN30750_c0_g1_i1.p1  ORF type:complete len:395 (+),score=120.45 TRINITY_DN30750_c0_g1_i1:146-1330(+)